MIDAPYLGGTATGPGGCQYWQPPAILRRAPIECRPLPNIGAAGTGGVEGADYYQNRLGYQPFEFLQATAVEAPAPYAEMMESVKAGFGRTMFRLPEVFGVSRQTLYHWLAGKVPRESHQEKIRQLAEAAQVFRELGFKPTSHALDRTLLRGKSFLVLIGEGGQGRETAKKLVRLSNRAAESKAKLDEILGGRKARLEAADIGAPSLDEG